MPDEKVYKYIKIKKRKNAKGKILLYYYFEMRMYDKETKTTRNVSAASLGLTSGSKCLGRARSFDKEKPDYFFENNVRARPYKKLFLQLFEKLKKNKNNIFTNIDQKDLHQPVVREIKTQGYLVKRIKKYKKKDGSISVYTYWEDVKQSKDNKGNYKQEYLKYIGKNPL